MTESVLFHNPRCSKSRGALGLLQQHGVSPRIVSYLDTPPGMDDLRALLRQLGLPARDLLRAGEPEYAALGLADPALDDEQLLAAIVAHPRLMERPIFVHGDRAVIGRPIERVLELLDRARAPT